VSNYPPGVSGNEFEIAGPDFEDDATRYCSTCECDREGMLQGYRSECWFICEVCGKQTDAEYDEDDYDEDWDDDDYGDDWHEGGPVD